jgi:hypothetical protein
LPDLRALTEHHLRRPLEQNLNATKKKATPSATAIALITRTK